MPAFTHVFFDLDGTLTDSAAGILNSCEYALDRLGLSVPREELYAVIGPPLLDSFRVYTGSEAGAREALRLYREYFTETGIFENEVYPGVPGMLSAIVEAGGKNVLATAKPLVFARRILDHFDLARYFSYAGGVDMEGPVYGKEDVIALDLRETGAAPQNVLMAGDRRDDVDAAHSLGLRCAGVRWGYAAPGEIDHAEWLCDSPADLALLAVTGDPGAR